jgi:DNA-binding MarR family transcriptional regulator
VTAPVDARLHNLLASSLNLAEDAQDALERASGLAGSATAALLALEEFLGDAHVGQLATVLGLTHSGGVRVVAQLEREGLATRHEGEDRRRVEVRLTAMGRRRARQARSARDEIIASATTGLSPEEARALELLLAKLVASRVARRAERRQADPTGARWCRTCGFGACGRPAGRCPAQVTASQLFTRSLWARRA